MFWTTFSNLKNQDHFKASPQPAVYLNSINTPPPQKSRQDSIIVTPSASLPSSSCWFRFDFLHHQTNKRASNHLFIRPCIVRIWFRIRFRAKWRGSLEEGGERGWQMSPSNKIGSSQLVFDQLERNEKEKEMSCLSFNLFFNNTISVSRQSVSCEER